MNSRLPKIVRLAGGARPRVLELCSGCGGMSLGFKAAGFDLIGHVEHDVTAAETYALNFAAPEGVAEDVWRTARDMETCGPDELAKAMGLESASSSFDILAAGLPCQAFARIGRSKLRSVRNDDDAYRNDPRAKLYRRFLEYVEAVQPIAIVIENVPDILNFGGHNVPEEICETLDEMGYACRYTLLNAAFYGVPQMRERLFLVAYDTETSACAPAFRRQRMPPNCRRGMKARGPSRSSTFPRPDRTSAPFRSRATIFPERYPSGPLYRTYRSFPSTGADRPTCGDARYRTDSNIGTSPVSTPTPS